MTQLTQAQGHTTQAHTTQRDDLVTTALCGWVIAGVVLDAWAHQHRLPETFFTPWHAVLYSGFLAVMTWMVGRVVVAAGPRRELAAVPAGYGLGVIGAAIFLLFGIGDGIWHTVFGIERDLEAALSPTHVGVFVGALLVFTTPLRAAWSSDRLGAAPSLRAFLPPLLSLTFTAVLVSFLFFYLSAFRDPAATVPFERWARVVAQPFPLRTWTRPNGIASVLATNLILLAPVLLLLRRWRPPFGSATLLFTTVAVLITATQEFAHGQVVLAAVAGGLAADWTIAWSSRAVGRTRAHRLVATITPVALWASYFLVLQLTDGIAWPAELWTGSIIFAALSGLALSVLMEPPPGPA